MELASGLGSCTIGQGVVVERVVELDTSEVSGPEVPLLENICPVGQKPLLIIQVGTNWSAVSSYESSALKNGVTH